MKDKTFQLIDININRATGALRFLEDFFRVSGNIFSDLSADLKDIRHSLNMLYPYDKLIKSRDVSKDHGSQRSTESETQKRSLDRIVLSNFRRVEESLRSLEELSKSVHIKEDRSSVIKKLRFTMYQIEKDYFHRRNYAKGDLEEGEDQ